MYACLLGFAWYLFRLARELFPDALGYAIVAPFMGLASVPPWWQQLYMYDYATLLVWAACLYYLQARRWDRYLLWFTLGMLNRETTVFLLLPFVAGLLVERPASKDAPVACHRAGRHRARDQGVAHDRSCRQSRQRRALERATGQIKQFLVAPYGLAPWITFLGVVLLLTYRWVEKPLVWCQLLTPRPAVRCLPHRRTARRIPRLHGDHPGGEPLATRCDLSGASRP